MAAPLEPDRENQPKTSLLGDLFGVGVNTKLEINQKAIITLLLVSAILTILIIIISKKL